MVAVREEVRVDLTPTKAFWLFTAGIGEWWPLEEGYSFGGDRAKEIYLEATPGGRFYERFVDGDELQVGRVVACEPPHRIAFTWKDPDWRGETEVEVSFTPEGARTRVTVEHRGFERLGPPGEAAARQFGGGWPRVMQAFASHRGSATGDAAELFERITSRYISDPTVSEGTGFGSSPGLRVRGKIFAMLAGSALVVKLPKDRVDQLVASGAATRFDPGHGRVMKEWLTVPVDQAADWDQLAADALAFVDRRS